MCDDKIIIVKWKQTAHCVDWRVRSARGARSNLLTSTFFISHSLTISLLNMRIAHVRTAAADGLHSFFLLSPFHVNGRRSSAECETDTIHTPHSIFFVPSIRLTFLLLESICGFLNYDPPHPPRMRFGSKSAAHFTLRHDEKITFFGYKESIAARKPIESSQFKIFAANRLCVDICWNRLVAVVPHSGAALAAVITFDWTRLDSHLFAADKFIAFRMINGPSAQSGPNERIPVKRSSEVSYPKFNSRWIRSRGFQRSEYS